MANVLNNNSTLFPNTTENAIETESQIIGRDTTGSGNLIVFILGCSASIAKHMSITVLSYNQFLEQQKRITSDNAKLTLIRFNGEQVLALRDKLFYN
jgi:hypothetical protein